MALRAFRTSSENRSPERTVPDWERGVDPKVTP
jgi:hypothetical protein